MVVDLRSWVGVEMEVEFEEKSFCDVAPVAVLSVCRKAKVGWRFWRSWRRP